MKIGILGAGAIGGYFGGILQQAGHDVAFVARGESLETLRTTGLTLIDSAGATVLNVTATASFAEAREALGGLDAAIIASKALPDNDTFGSEEDRAQLQGVPVVTTHNSVEIPYLAADVFGADNVLAGVARVYATRLGPARVKRNPGPLSLAFGLLPQAEHAEGTLRTGEQLVEALRAGGAHSALEDDALADIWAKAMFVTTTGALGALVDEPIGYLRTAIRGQLKAFMREVESVARALGVNLAETVVEDTLGFVDQQYAEATSSMQRDITAGLPSELDAQVGAIRRMGKRAGVATPLFDFAQEVLEAR
ncbi:2-dehydropantoate 2-reductase [Corynebacterium flavescens]|uniref:2-dehydropantoate 2-reductase n=1 Tax=Corynebacterium flavescens TaxID=28028 RepID=UPI00264880CA|nr:2-dehydropantoate 2-reductase [Corynebacterium flavescens]MDN6099901.1 2-dehydropantoate 2-reductase [Corynebacterium flavescens]MDN6198277.1 2-dehydropantoate 2-reductase [Corynebacterium flavescens]MDN6227187.1 2-dehydropantoate 2-reductase [Corynebacterium flavescens]MDN6237130.1 2-dehydropantoate 2-reductase [Corynebacterium flavescens]MDN6432094.1 2-dehydropantoate 2-reductase [Corynebacterium flavescens]